MKKEKILLSIIIVLVALVICIIGLILILNKSQEDTMLATDELIVNTTKDKYNNLKEVTNRNNFYIVQRSIEKFYTYYSEMFKDPLEDYLIKPEEGTVNIEAIKSERKKKIYSILEDEYLAYKEITLDNIESKLTEVGDVSINIQNMYYTENDKGISAYFVQGTKTDTLDSSTTQFCMMVKVDLKNRTYKVLLDDYIKTFYKDLQSGQNIEIEDEEITNDTYNVFSYQHITDQEYINDLFAHYKNMLRLNKEDSYNLLDEAYKNQCFEDSEEYLSYINSNYSKILSAKLDTYNKENNNSYTQYLFKDTKENYYIFKETAPFHYTVMLDNYAVPTEDFTREYNKSSEVEKVVLNIKKFFMGIDSQNYGYSYNVLADSFKNNEYPTKQDFINYAKENFFKENEIEYIDYEKQNGVYIYTIKIKDATAESSDEKEFNIIVKLKNGTDFEMSFGE